MSWERPELVGPVCIESTSSDQCFVIYYRHFLTRNRQACTPLAFPCNVLFLLCIRCLCWVRLCVFFRRRLPNPRFRMIVTKTPLVVPTRLEWLGMLFMIGIFGFFAQVGARFIMFFLMIIAYYPDTPDYGSRSWDRESGIDRCLYSGHLGSYSLTLPFY